MKTKTRVLIMVLLSGLLGVAATADVQVTKLDCSGPQTTTFFASNSAEDVGDRTNIYRVWIRTTNAADVVIEC